MLINPAIRKSLALIFLALFSGFGGYAIGLSPQQALVVFVFSLSIFGSLFFWDAKLSFAFIGSGLFLMMHAVSLEEFIRFASLDVIIFLIAMMIIVGMMKEAGFFAWLITMLLRVKKLDGRKLFIITMILSAVFSALMGEVASIIVMATTLLEICYLLDMSPVPLIISSVFATNIGSASTVLGNPVGVLIAARGGLTFEDFIVHALPVSLAVLIITVVLLLWWYREYIREITEKLKIYEEDKWFLKLISLPPDTRTKVSIGIFLATIVLISLHRRFEIFLGLEENTMLMMFPVISAGIVMLYRHDKARIYVEREVEWNSLLFFLFLFGQAGVIHASGVGSFLAGKMMAAVGQRADVLSGVILFTSGILSSVLDNVVTVASYVPIIRSLGDAQGTGGANPFWWALLFGACFGGNITMIGSTANIVALGILEKKVNLGISFGEWMKKGLLIGMVGMMVSLLLLLMATWIQGA